MPPKKPKTTIAPPFPSLHGMVHGLKAAGPEGFEGLVATALASLTGLTFRLAKSGLQFGRDATTPRGRFAIAMEAKRYGDGLTLEDLVGKAALAGHALGGDTDLWVLCATSEIGDDTVRQLESILETSGMALLALDWANGSLPRLAVLLAAEEAVVLGWFRKHRRTVAATELRQALREVSKRPDFAAAKTKLLEDVTAHRVGLGTLAAANGQWFARRFTDRAASKRSFNQVLTISDPSRPAVLRPVIEANLASAMSSSADVVAILGGEGVGKTWAIARWWRALPDAPILIVSAASTVRLLDPMDPLRTIARLLALQEDGDREASALRWLRRLERWRLRPSDGRGPRFLVLLDGLNERSSAPWADLLVNLVPEVQQLGGRMVITCREGFWKRKVVPRIEGSISVEAVPVGNFEEAELRAVLDAADVPGAEVPPRVRDAMLTPRVCTVALNLLQRLKAQPYQLTVGRLLLEHWRHRMEERGDLASHDIADFEGLLRSHARLVLGGLSAGGFDRNAWRSHSDAAKRDDGRDLHDDLTEIEEGRFMRLVPGQPDRYEFKEETLPFALGLLIAAEVAVELRRSGRKPSDVIEVIVDEVGGFDVVGEAHAAAAGIACLDAGYPRLGREALIAAWLTTQNLSDDRFRELVAYAPARPEALLDAAELLAKPSEARGRREWITNALLHTRDEPAVQAALHQRLPLWFARWSRKAREFGDRNADEDRRIARREAEIAARIGGLAEAEGELLRGSCIEVEDVDEALLDRVATILAAGRPLARYARALQGRSLAVHVGSDFLRTHESLAWTIRLNMGDFGALADGIRAGALALTGTGSSDTGRQAAALSLRLLGTVEDARVAEELDETSPGQSWRLVEEFCATDPYDPASNRPDNLERAIGKAGEISADLVSTYSSTSREDLDLRLITGGLARFEPRPIIDLMHRILLTAPERREISLSHFAHGLADHAPLVTGEAREAVLQAYENALSDSGVTGDDERSYVAADLLLGLLPNLPADRQVNLLLRLPDTSPEFSALQDGLAGLSALALEQVLTDAEKSQGTKPLRRVLLFASAGRPVLTDRSREIVARALRHPDPVIADLAADVVYVARDTILDAEVIAFARTRNRTKDDVDAGYRRARAVAAAIIDSGRIDDIELVAPMFLGWVSRKMGGGGLDRLATAVEAAVARLLQPIAAPEPQQGRIVREDQGERDEPTTLIKDEVGRAKKRGLGEDAGPAVSAKREKVLREEAESFLTELTAEDAEWVLRSPDRNALAKIVDADPARAGHWLGLILAESNCMRLRPVRNLGLALASAYSRHDVARAGRLFDHLHNLRSPVHLVFGKARVPAEWVTVFGAADGPEFDERRTATLARASNDSEIEDVVLAAELVDRGPWLDTWVGEEIATGHPGRMGRALTVAGFRSANAFSEEVLSRDWGPDFLGVVATAARDAYRRDGWCRAWAEQALAADDPENFWRYAQLATGVADRRYESWLRLSMERPLVWRFGRRFAHRLAERATRRSKKREDNLFGIKKPDHSIALALRG